MMSTTKHRERTCLTDDDLEGLNFLYPTCAGAQAKPNCIKRLRHSGWLRLAVAVAIPYLTCTIIIMLIQCAVKYHQKRRLHEMEIRNKKIKGEARQLEGHLQRMPTWMQMQAAGIGDVIPGFGRGSFQNRRGSAHDAAQDHGCSPRWSRGLRPPAPPRAPPTRTPTCSARSRRRAWRAASGRPPGRRRTTAPSTSPRPRSPRCRARRAAGGELLQEREGAQPGDDVDAGSHARTNCRRGRAALVGSVSIEVASPSPPPRSPPKSKPAKPQPAGSGFVDFGALGGGQQDI